MVEQLKKDRIGHYGVIIEATSMGAMYAEDMMKNNLVPLVINPLFKNIKGSMQERLRMDAAAFFPQGVRVISGLDQDQLLDELSNLDIDILVPGMEEGVPLADYLSSKLGLRGNDPSTTCLRNNKYYMQETLKKKNIRYVRTRRITHIEDIMDFWNETGCKKAVIKPSISTGSLGAYICSTVEECIERYRCDLTSKGIYGDYFEDILIQDCIVGKQYAVNTVSIDGIHKVADIWEYEMFDLKGEGTACNGSRLLPLSSKTRPMVQYVIEVLDALEMANGACHTEIMIDDDGPVLIETNPRPMGIFFDKEILDDALGHHTTDLVVKAYSDPDWFKKSYDYEKKKTLAIKNIICHLPLRGSSDPYRAIVRFLDTSRFMHIDGGEGVIHDYPKTVDGLTTPGSIVLCHENENLVERDLEILTELEEHYPKLLISELIFDGDAKLFEKIGHKHICVVDVCSDMGDVDSSKRITLAASSEWKLEDLYVKIGELKASIRDSVKIFIHSSIYDRVPYGKDGVMVIMRFAKLGEKVVFCSDPMLD